MSSDLRKKDIKFKKYPKQVVTINTNYPILIKVHKIKIVKFSPFNLIQFF